MICRPAGLVTASNPLLLMLVFVACTSPKAPSTIALTVVVRTPPYPRPRCLRGPRGASSAEPPAMRGQRIPNARLRLQSIEQPEEKARTGTTDKNGEVVFGQLHPGRYRLLAHARGHRPELRGMLVLHSDTRHTLRLFPCFGIKAPKRPTGFDTQVLLAAQRRCDPIWESAQFTWSIVERPPRSPVNILQQRGRNASLNIPPMGVLRNLPSMPQLLSFSHDQAGEYVVRLNARLKTGESSTAFALVAATSVSTGVTSVAPQHTYHPLGPKQGPWRWRVKKKPKGWRVKLTDAKSRAPGVTPLPRGIPSSQPVVVVEETVSKTTFSLVVAYWDEVRRDCGRSDCHESMAHNWSKTKHARAWQRLLDGELDLQRGEVALSCADCHSLGYDATFNTHGYDDVARKAKIRLPHQLQPGNFDRLPPRLKSVSNVYCLACHGPARVDPPIAEQPGIFGAGVCARCHDRLPEQTVAAEWRQSSHSNARRAAALSERSECAVCHTAQGHYREHYAMARPPSQDTLVLSCCEVPQPITCQACHNAMLPLHPRQLHVWETVLTRSNRRLDKIGAGAVCIRCHEAGQTARDRLRYQLAPHAAQVEISYGYGAFVMGKSPAAPAKESTACAGDLRQGCVGCHMHPGSPAGEGGPRRIGGHTFSVSTKRGLGIVQQVAPCQGCHKGLSEFNTRAKSDYDRDGKIEGFQSEVSGLLSELKTRIDRHITARRYQSCGRTRRLGRSFRTSTAYRLVIVDGQGHDLGDCNGNGTLEAGETSRSFSTKDLPLYQAAYNYSLVLRDSSLGLHNPPYAVAILRSSIVALE